LVVKREAASVDGHPPELFRRDARHECMGRDVFCDHGSGRDEAMFPKVTPQRMVALAPTVAPRLTSVGS